jgi:soluble P-type ATPase
MTTMREVAAHARVSQKTVSRVFNDDPQGAEGLGHRVGHVVELGHGAQDPLARLRSDLGVVVTRAAESCSGLLLLQ